MVALMIFQFGLLAVAALILQAQRIQTRAELRLRATLETHRIGDSLLTLFDPGRGAEETEWGILEWEPGGEEVGSLLMTALSSDGADTLAILHLWPVVPIPSGTQPGKERKGS